MKDNKMMHQRSGEEREHIDAEDLTKIAQILIEIQLMKSNFTKFKEYD
jgi:hypothetical protein